MSVEKWYTSLFWLRRYLRGTMFQSDAQASLYDIWSVPWTIDLIISLYILVGILRAGTQRTLSFCSWFFISTKNKMIHENMNTYQTLINFIYTCVWCFLFSWIGLFLEMNKEQKQTVCWVICIFSGLVQKIRTVELFCDRCVVQQS